MMKNLGILCILCLLATTGCAQNSQENLISTDNQTVSASFVSSKNTLDAPSFPSLAVKAEIDPLLIKGDIKNITYADNTTVLIEADKLYLYDLASAKVLAQAEKEDFSQPVYQRCERGFACIGNYSKDPFDGKVVLYNDQLEKTAEIPFKTISGSDEVFFADSVTVSPDANKIAITGVDGVTVYDVRKKSKFLAVNLQEGSPQTVKPKIMHVSQLMFSGDSHSLALLTGVENGSQQSLPGCGKVNVDGSGFVSQRVAFDPLDILGTYNGFALLGEDDRNLTGRVLRLDTTTGATDFLPLETKVERAVFGSDTGRYYASSSLEDTGCTVRVYETATGKKVFEQTIPHGGDPLYVARNPVVRILDDSRTCIVLMGNRQDDLKTKVTILPF